MSKKKLAEVKQFPGAHPPSPSYHTFSQVYEKAVRMEGEQITPRQLLDSGKDFIIHRYFKRPSKYGQTPYVSVQIEMGGVRHYFNSASAPLVDQLDRTAAALPYRAKLVEKKSGTGNTYTTLA